jgi:FdhE protein
VSSLWQTRRARAVYLLGETTHAEEILGFYAGLTEAQERVADGVPATDWLKLVRGSAEDVPWLRVKEISLDGLAFPFRDFLSSIREVGTETIRAGSRALLSGEDRDRLESLCGALDDWGKVDDGAAFHTRAFLEPVVTSLAAADSRQPMDWTGKFCFACGGAPQVAVLRDLPDALGSRSLICSGCATEGRFPRFTCPSCGETDAAKLPVHTAESIDHVRIDECVTCSHYIKTIDMRKKGDCVPVVDELASVELDMWARERGLTKIRTNVLGL